MAKSSKSPSTPSPASPVTELEKAVEEAKASAGQSAFVGLLLLALPALCYGGEGRASVYTLAFGASLVPSLLAWALSLHRIARWKAAGKELMDFTP